MNMHFIHRLIPASVSALLVTLSAFGQGANAQGQFPPEYSKGEILTDQRVMSSLIKDADFHIGRGIMAVGNNLPDSAKVSVLRATGRIAQVDALMKTHPEHIERVAMVLFQRRETMRKELRASYDKLRKEFGAVEDQMYALRRDMLRKGLFGEELKGQVAVLDAASKLLPEIQQKDPALAKKVQGLMDQINEALAAGDTATADKLIQQLYTTLTSGGYQQNIEDAKKKIEAGAGTEGTAPISSAGAAQALAGGGSLESTAGGVKVMGADGQAATIQGATATGGGKARLADGTEVDLNGSQVLPDGSIRLADGRVIKDGKIAAPAVAAAPVTPPKNATLLDANGNEVSEDYVWENGEGKGVDKIFVGGKGKRLTKETKVTVRATPTPGKANTYEVTKTAGESRSWAFIVAPVPGSEKKAAGSVAITLALSDGNGGTGFAVSKWDITSQAGAPSVSGTTGTQVTATFAASATYSITVSGTTDWGSAFAITTSLPVGVE
jgi:hypothetical protein